MKVQMAGLLFLAYAGGDNFGEAAEDSERVLMAITSEMEENGLTEEGSDRRLGPVGDKVGGLWQEALFGGVGSKFSDTCGCVPGPDSEFLSTPPPFTWHLPYSVVFEVTDAFLRGDRFKVFDKGNSLGLTSEPSTGGSCGNDPNACFADPKTSSRAFVLGPGFHSIKIKVTSSPFGGGAAYFRLVRKIDIDICGDFDDCMGHIDWSFLLNPGQDQLERRAEAAKAKADGAVSKMDQGQVVKAAEKVQETTQFLWKLEYKAGLLDRDDVAAEARNVAMDVAHCGIELAQNLIDLTGVDGNAQAQVDRAEELLYLEKYKSSAKKCRRAVYIVTGQTGDKEIDC